MNPIPLGRLIEELIAIRDASPGNENLPVTFDRPAGLSEAQFPNVELVIPCNPEGQGPETDLSQPLGSVALTTVF